MLQSLLRLLANEEEESVAAEQLDVSLPTLSWDHLRDVTNLFSWFFDAIFIGLNIAAFDFIHIRCPCCHLVFLGE